MTDAGKNLTADSVEGMVRLSVLLPMPFAGPLDYLYAAPVSEGSIVRVPLGPREVTGVVWPAADTKHRSAPDKSDRTVPVDKLKPVAGRVDMPPLTLDLCRFVDWVAAYTLTSRGRVLRMILSVPAALEPPPVQRIFAPGRERPARLTPARARVLDAIAAQGPLSARAAAEAAGVSESVVRGLAKAGALTMREVSADAPYPLPDPTRPGPALSDEQAAAAAAVCGTVRAGEYAVFLLDGVTGSGKTEVYFEAVAAALSRDDEAQILVLVPEIALTSQWLDRFEARFGARPVVWHSDVGQAARRRAWAATARGNARVIVGARSALFLPFRKLGLIVVDEEHDPSFKQEDGVLYHARDMAVLRASLGGCPIVLASATPSLETAVNADAGRYRRLRLTARHGGAALPDIRAVDMRRDPPPPGRWIAPPLEADMRDTLARGEQVMLFLNRRGYAPLTLCRTCGHRLECPHCSAWMVEHRFQRRMQCHHCGHSGPVPPACPSCGAEDSLVACGPGVERLFEEVGARFPEARIAVMTSDTLDHPSETARFVADIAAGNVDIVIGTQIVTKGYHFPQLTLVGVIDADLGLRGGDLRAGERTYQQLTQVAGRAGRAARPGRVFLQTYDPAHPVVDALVKGDGARFMALEEDGRRRHAMPPFGRLVALILSGREESAVIETGRRLAATAPSGQTPGSEAVQVLGPAPAPLARLRGYYRVRLLLHQRGLGRVQALMRDWLKRSEPVKGVTVKVDIDPYSFL